MMDAILIWSPILRMNTFLTVIAGESTSVDLLDQVVGIFQMLLFFKYILLYTLLYDIMQWTYLRKNE